MLRKSLGKILATSFLLIGASLLAINIYGLFQNIRPAQIENHELRFKNDQPISYAQALEELTRKPDESDTEFAKRATKVIAQGLAHIHWEKYHPEKFNQLVPIWENYFLYFMGKFSGIPEYEKYHFANYKRSLKRGIGLCGDASMTLSQVLDKHGINNKIVTYPGHVMVAAKFDDNQSMMLDADFGVIVPFSSSAAKVQFQDAANLYLEAGYSSVDKRFFENMYQQPSKEWHGVSHFITKKYYFEKISYWLKWLLPIGLIISFFWLYPKNKPHKTK